MTVIEIKKLKKDYYSGFLRKRKVEALRGIDLSVEKGEIFGVLGPNGAGKTTLLNILMGLIVPDSGEVSIFGKKTGKKEDMNIKKRMNMCSGNPNFPWSLTVRQTLKFYGMLYNISGDMYKKREEELANALELGPIMGIRFDELSTGNKQRLSLAKSLINDPDILLLDEPTIGLDPDISVKIRRFIKDFHAEKQKTTLLTTHYMKEAEEMCGRIAFIKNGRIFALGTAGELMKMTKKEDMDDVFIELANKQD